MIPDEFGFIITRHVNSVKTNEYWNHNVKLLKMYYPRCKIFIIDDFSHQEYIISFHNYANVTVIPAKEIIEQFKTNPDDYRGRGEFLPYLWLNSLKDENMPFKKAVFIHDSVFFHKRIPFEQYKAYKAYSLWTFPRSFCSIDLENTLNICDHLSLSMRPLVKRMAYKSRLNTSHWKGCFGVQSYIDVALVQKIFKKYDLGNLLDRIKCRADRCSLERIMGIILFIENNFKNVSIFGNLLHKPFIIKHGFNYSFDEYKSSFSHKKVLDKVVKVFTGR